MTSKRETVLALLHARLAQANPNMRVLRNAVLPERVPEHGLVILRDGDPGEPEVTLSPLRYHWEHRAEVELFSREGAATFDALAQEIGKVIAADRRLNGECDWVEADKLVPVVLPVEGAAPIEGAILGIVLHYTSEDPLA